MDWLAKTTCSKALFLLPNSTSDLPKVFEAGRCLKYAQNTLFCTEHTVMPIFTLCPRLFQQRNKSSAKNSGIVQNPNNFVTFIADVHCIACFLLLFCTVRPRYHYRYRNRNRLVLLTELIKQRHKTKPVISLCLSHIQNRNKNHFDIRPKWIETEETCRWLEKLWIIWLSSLLHYCPYIQHLSHPRKLMDFLQTQT